MQTLFGDRPGLFAANRHTQHVKKERGEDSEECNNLGSLEIYDPFGSLRIATIHLKKGVDFE